MESLNRRTAMKLGAAGALTFSLGFWRESLAAPAVVGPGPYGPLGRPDDHGVRLPQGFSARLVGVSGRQVKGTTYEWHGQPDGAATFATRDGGWVYACNSELNGTSGGAGAIRFGPGGAIRDAYRILGGTKWNCSGGATPWGTWLSGEEFRQGRIWECDPYRPGQGIERRAMGTFPHEAAVVDPETGYVYETEDHENGRIYRFRPAAFGDLSAGVLEAARRSRSGDRVTWVRVDHTKPERSDATSPFRRGEGAWFSDGHFYFTTTSDDRVWALNTATGALEIIYDAAVLGAAAPLHDPDNITVHERSGDIYVAEDADDLQLVLLADARRNRVAAPFLQLRGHGGSEIAGPAFAPDGTRLYFSSQRGTDGDGLTFEVTGPFRN